MLHHDIESQFVGDANHILNAYKMANMSHKVGNISTAGDAVERAIRKFIQKRITNKYYVTQGHIVDLNLSTSGQLDILIADDKGSPIIYSYDNGTELLTYESIYAIGEIKSSYSKKTGAEPIKEFIEKVKSINETLDRELVNVFQRSQDYKMYGNNFDGKARTEDGWLYKNPIFKFMFFVSSRSLKLDEVINTLNIYDKKHLPNIIFLLDRGIIINVTSLPNVIESTTTVDNYPEFIREELSSSWQLLEFENIGAATLAYLAYALNFHLSRCVVSRADLLKYHGKLFKIRKSYS